MAAFTPIDPGVLTNVLQADLVNEIVRGIRERRAPTISAADGLPANVAPGDVAQSAATWAGWQDTIEDLCATIYLDHTVDLETNMTGFTAMTLARAQELSGLTYGFRRATAWDPAVNDWTDYNDPMYSYGHAQQGDIFGPWILFDLQALLKVLKWTIHGAPIGAWITDAAGFSAQSSELSTCTDAVTDLATQWAGFAWDPDALTTLGPYHASGSIAFSWIAAAARRRSKGTIPLVTEVSCDIEWYAFMQAAYDMFVDVDGLGAEEDKYHNFDFASYADDTPGDRVSDWLGNSTANPLPLTGLSCPTKAVYGIEATLIRAVVKHAVSNA
jgi:hypothetical protein